MMRIPRIYNVTSELPCKYVIKRMAYIEHQNAVENPTDGLGDVATRTFGF